MPIALFLVVGMMVSCEMSVFYDEHKTIKDNVWNIDDKMVFNVEVDSADMLERYNFLIDLRNTREYPYSNAFLFIKTTFPNGGYALDKWNAHLPILRANGMARFRRAMLITDSICVKMLFSLKKECISLRYFMA